MLIAPTGLVNKYEQGGASRMIDGWQFDDESPLAWLPIGASVIKTIYCLLEVLGVRWRRFTAGDRGAKQNLFLY